MTGEPESHRPRDFALLLLAGGPRAPRQRARDQQADRAGEAIRRSLLDEIAAIDPEPDELPATLARIVEGQGGSPSGPLRAVAALILQEWEAARRSPACWSWLVGQAIEAGDGSEDDAPGRGRSTHVS
jgi:hypothetical protein